MTIDTQKSNVIDMPLVWADGKDGLGMEAYASSLVRFIEKAATPFTIAIQGEWGSGKTSLMRQICHELCGDSKAGEALIKNDGKSFCGVWLDTWEYALMRSPQDVQLQVISSMAEAVDGVTENKNRLKEAAKKAAKPLFRILTLGAAAYAGKAITDGLSQAIPEEMRDWIPSLGNDGQSVKEFRCQLEEAVKSVQDTTDSSKKYKGVLFFIDDLDRIDPAVAVQVLEILKNLFEVKGCIFVLAIDYNVVVKGLKNKFGERTDENEREFRSFFDKIIQLPFSMPVAGYEIGGYLDDMLKNVGYYTEQELRRPLDERATGELKAVLANELDGGDTARQKPKVRDLLRHMVKLSTAKNPRSVKRLVNSLSLIKTILDEKKKNLTDEQKLLCFGVVCVQITYPRIYDMLLAQPDFAGKWNENFARSQGLPSLENPPQDMANAADWEEWALWQRITYLAAQNATWMKARFFDISRLLMLLAASVPADHLGREMKVVLSSAATTGTGTMAVQENLLSRDEFLSGVQDNTSSVRLNNLFTVLENRFKGSDGAPLLNVEHKRSVTLVRVKHPVALNLLLRIKLDGQEVQRAVPSSNTQDFKGFKPLADGDEKPDSALFKELEKVYNNLADKEHQLK